MPRGHASPAGQHIVENVAVRRRPLRTVTPEALLPPPGKPPEGQVPIIGLGDPSAPISWQGGSNETEDVLNRHRRSDCHTRRLLGTVPPAMAFTMPMTATATATTRLLPAQVVCIAAPTKRRLTRQRRQHCYATGLTPRLRRRPRRQQPRRQQRSRLILLRKRQQWEKSSRSISWRRIW